MKRLLQGILLLILLAVLAVVIVSAFMGSIVRKGVETAGLLIVKVPVRLDGASLALFSGSGELRGFLVSNPDGFKSPSAFQVKAVNVALEPRSVFSHKVVVRSVRIEAPEITFEGGLQGNNLSKLLDNIRGTNTASTGSSAQSSGRVFQLDDLVLTGGHLHLNLPLVAGQSATVPLPEIHLAGLGQGPDGITPAELSEKILQAVVDSSTKAAASQLGALGKGMSNAAQQLGNGAAQGLDKVTKGIGDLFKKN
jgi:uncharacterized protein involved in outer membrane biogenesis